MHRRHRYARRQLNLLEAEALPAQPPHFGHFGRGKAGSSRFFRTTGLPRFDALGKAYPLLLGDSGQNSDDGLPEKACAVKILLGEGLERHTGYIQALKMIERFAYPFPAEAVQAPEQHHVETPLVGVEKELLELRPFGRAAAFLVAVLLINEVAQPLGEGAQFEELVIIGLALIAGGDAGIDGGFSHSKKVALRCFPFTS